MQRLVDDLLTLSALESEQSPLQEAEFAIVPLLLRGLGRRQGALRRAGTRSRSTIGDAANVLGSRDELASAFGNLVSNAVRYTPDGGTHRARLARRRETAANSRVADTGIGIAAEHIPRLTERFYRVDRSRSRATGGTGLGLAIVKHVLIRHQAELDRSTASRRRAAASRCAFRRSGCSDCRARKRLDADARLRPSRHPPRRHASAGSRAAGATRSVA